MRDDSTKELSSRHVKEEEARRLGVESGWYTTKINGTFVTGPHTTAEEATLKIAEMKSALAPIVKRKL